MANISRSRSRRTRKREKESFARQRAPRKNMLLPVLVATAAWLSAFLLLMGLKPFYSSDFMVGQRAPSTVVAMTDFESIDLAATELSRQQAENNVLPVFSVDYSNYRKTVQQLDAIFEKTSRLRETSVTNKASVEVLKGELEEMLTQANIDLQIDKVMDIAPKEGSDEGKLADTIKNEIKRVYSRGIASRKEKQQNFQGVASGGRIEVEAEKDRTFVVDVNALLTPDEAAHAVTSRTMERSEADFRRRILRDLIDGMLEPNLKFNPELTNAKRKIARKSVEPRYREVRKGETIVNIGEQVTEQIDEMLLAHKKRLNETTTLASRVLERVGQGCILLAVLIVCAGLFSLMRPRPKSSPSILLMMLTVAVLVLFAVRGSIYISTTTRLLPPALVNTFFPIAFGALLAGLLTGTSVAIVVGVWTSCVAAVMFDNSFIVLLEGLSVTIVAALTVGTVRKRSQVFRAGLFVGLMMMFLLLAIGILQNQSFETVLSHSLLGLANGFVCALMVLILLPFFEVMFGQTTDIRLLELSDMGHPLLRRLALEAPGTYHHSLMVANLGQSAADEIGANSLLVRVTAYFHDIGKLSKPGFFAENIKGDRNPHDELSPHMSMLVIEAHVKEGITMAKRHKLPPPVLDAIEQHHASGTMKYFYHRALKQAENGKSDEKGAKNRIGDEHFKYDCPKPRTKEMAILSLADSVEAASRSLEKPHASRIMAMVDQVVETKIKDGQLDECNLTLAELNAIKRSFVFTITNMQHGRVAYPKEEKDNEGRDSKQAESKDAEQKVADKNGRQHNGESGTAQYRS